MIDFEGLKEVWEDVDLENQVDTAPWSLKHNMLGLTAEVTYQAGAEAFNLAINGLDFDELDRFDPEKDPVARPKEYMKASIELNDVVILRKRRFEWSKEAFKQLIRDKLGPNAAIKTIKIEGLQASCTVFCELFEVIESLCKTSKANSVTRFEFLVSRMNDFKNLGREDIF